MLRTKYWLPMLLVGAMTALTGCAQDVDDIDRTQPDLIKKSDLLDGEWFIRATITDVPATSDTVFEGLTFDTERIVWEITSSYLVGYRAYDVAPGASNSVTTVNGDYENSGIDNDNQDGSNRYLGTPVVAYPITSHVDVQRSYNPATLEPGNVISENGSDREWYEREYMRVNWSQNRLNSFFGFDGSALGVSGFHEFVGEGGPEEDAIRLVYDDEGQLDYFDFVQRSYVEPTVMSCIYWLYGIGIGDCGPQQIEARTSVMRADDDTYETLYYDNQDMARFGYFRTERLSYDRQYGSTLEGRIQLANRHNIWEDAWRRDANGDIVIGDDGRGVALPMAERTPSPVVYHLSPNFPEGLYDDVVEVARSWDIAFSRAVAAAQNEGNVDAELDTPMFILCNNPVTTEAVYPEGLVTDACGAEGTVVQMGDLRYSVVWWVDDLTQAGLLGYGPSGQNPETGETLSGTAYVYGAAVDRSARYATDLIRFINGDLQPEDLADADYVRNRIIANRDTVVDPRPAGAATSRFGSTTNLAAITEPMSAREMVTPQAAAVLEAIQLDSQDGTLDSLRIERGWEARRNQDLLRESGLDELAMNGETLAVFGINPDYMALTDDVIEPARLSSYMQMLTPEFEQARHMAVHGDDCVLAPDHLDDAILGIAEYYAGRTDYDEIFEEIRGLIFKAVMEHEIGHTVGLRHNFGASHDALNYFDEFWELKKEGYPTTDDDGNATIRPFGEPESLADAYGIARQTPAQITGRMREYQYSSIMDYGSSFNTDFSGLGRYDLQAILYAYTGGVNNEENRVESGYVEVWPEPPAAVRSRFTEARNPNGFNETFERGVGVGYRWPTEEYHYSLLVDEFAPGDPDAMVANLFDRSYMRLDEVLDQVERDVPNRPVEVPYVFCTDDFRSTRQFCRTWDRGADPMEQTMAYIDRYRNYYYFDYYRRGRTDFMGLFASQVGSSHYRRIFQPLVDGYQRWLLTAGVGDLPDDGGWLGTQWTAAAYAGLNLVVEAALTPEPGSYELNDETGEFELVSYSRIDSDMYVENGNGRLRYTRYPRDTGEGMYFYMYPTQSGHYWTIVNALFALTSSSTRVIGESSSGAFDTAYSIPPYLVFEEEMTRLFNGIVLDDQSVIAPLVDVTSDGPVFTQRPMATLDFTSGERVNPETGETLPDGLPLIDGVVDRALGNGVDIDLGFSEAVTAQILAYQAFTTNYSPRYLEQAKIWVLDAGSTPNLDGTFDLIQFCDPMPGGGGACYAARAPQEGDVSNLAADWIRQGQDLERQWEEAVARGEDPRQIGFDIDNLIQDIHIGISLDYYLGRTF